MNQAQTIVHQPSEDQQPPTFDTHRCEQNKSTQLQAYGYRQQESQSQTQCTQREGKLQTKPQLTCCLPKREHFICKEQNPFSHQIKPLTSNSHFSILLYHVTDRQNVDSITKNGLNPNLGRLGKGIYTSDEKIVCAKYALTNRYRYKQPVILTLQTYIKNIITLNNAREFRGLNFEELAKKNVQCIKCPYYKMNGRLLYEYALYKCQYTIIGLTPLILPQMQRINTSKSEQTAITHIKQIDDAKIQQIYLNKKEQKEQKEQNKIQEQVKGSIQENRNENQRKMYVQITKQQQNIQISMLNQNIQRMKQQINSIDYSQKIPEIQQHKNSETILFQFFRSLITKHQETTKNSKKFNSQKQQQANEKLKQFRTQSNINKLKRRKQFAQRTEIKLYKFWNKQTRNIQKKKQLNYLKSLKRLSLKTSARES